MTDPVDTHALRNPLWSNLDAVGALLDAAADEVDRLRRELDEARISEGLAYTGLTRLRDAIGNAPHAIDCKRGGSGNTRVPCTCWKADAL